MKKVIVFGVFDGLHDGHREFLRAAKKEGDWLVVAVAQDHVVQHLKGRLPDRKIGDRMEQLQAEGLADEIVPGDSEIGAWHIVRKQMPHIIALGYDQAALQKDLALFLETLGRFIEVLVMPPHEPEKYHTSILREKT